MTLNTKYFTKQWIKRPSMVLFILIAFLYPSLGQSEDRYRPTDYRGAPDARLCIRHLIEQKTSQELSCVPTDDLENFMMVFWNECTLPSTFTPKIRAFPLIPKVLLIGFMAGISREQYINIQINMMKNSGADSDFTVTDIENKIQIALQKKKQQNLKSWTYHDKNGDGSITLRELTESSSGECFFSGVTEGREISKEDCDKFIQRGLLQAMEKDTNRDGAVTHDEMLAIEPSLEKAINNNFDNMRSYLALDPNNDGRMTSEELKEVAGKSFSIFDSDKNGILSLEEEKNFSASEYDNGQLWKEPYPLTLSSLPPQ